MPQIFWSCLAAKQKELDLTHVKDVLAAGVDRIHCDVSDHDRTIDLEDILLLLDETDVPLDIHLATQSWEVYVETLQGKLRQGDCLSVQADMLQEHNIADFQERMKGSKADSGLAVMSDFMQDEGICRAMAKATHCTVMAVTPGVTGMSFNYEVIRSINFIRDNYPNCLISLDGGVNEKTIRLIAQLGVDSVISGSFISNFSDPNDGVSLINTALRVRANGAAKISKLSDAFIELPQLRATDALQKVVHEITDGGVGMVSICNENGQDIGIISDGDIRRFISKEVSIDGVTAQQVCNLFPLIFNPDDELRRVFELFLLDFRFDRILVWQNGRIHLLGLNSVVESVL